MAEEQKQLGGDGGLHVHMVTPVGPIADVKTDAITAPGEQGEFEILPGHIPFLTGMHPGLLCLGESRERQIFAVSQGYLRVDLNGAVEVLVEQAVAAADIDLDAAKADLKEAADELDRWDAEQNADWLNLRERHDWAQARVDAHAAA